MVILNILGKTWPNAIGFNFSLRIDYDYCKCVFRLLAYPDQLLIMDSRMIGLMFLR
jgi:hypothetical protein